MRGVHISALEHCRKMKVSISINDRQGLLILSCLNDLTNCQKCFNVVNILLYISAVTNARKLKFNRYVHLPSTNVNRKDVHASMISFNGKDMY